MVAVGCVEQAVDIKVGNWLWRDATHREGKDAMVEAVSGINICYLKNCRKVEYCIQYTHFR
jgi:hypothetical protein